MADKVEGFKYIENPTRISNPKDHLKKLFIQLLRELFSLDPSIEYSESNRSAVGGDTGLNIWPKFPQTMAELPVLTISLSDLLFEAMTLNRNLPRDRAQQLHDKFQDSQEYVGQYQAYRCEGVVSFDVFTATDTQRDDLIDRVFDYLVWNSHSANLDVYSYFMERGIVLRTDRVRLSGDQEIPLDTGDLTYLDGISLPFVGEVYSPRIDAVPLEGIDFEINGTRQ
jgi:hypothetical protein